MANKLSDHLSIEPTLLREIGCFDPILNVDSKFFIDPKSLIASTEPEFKDSYAKINTRFTQMFQLLKASKQEGDHMWNMAYKLFPLGEVSNLCIGYGFDNTGGRGIGPVLATQTLLNLKEFIDSGIDDPVLFELIGVFQKDIGSDLISDLIAQIILDDIKAYTTRVVKTLEAQTTVKPQAFKGFNAFNNPDNNKPLYLIPEAILQPLPVAEDWSEVEIVCAANAKVRKDFAEMIGGDTWKKATKVRKEVLNSALHASPKATRDMIERYRNKGAKTAYDFEEDPDGEYSWYDFAKEFTDKNPLALSPTGGDPAKVLEVVRAITNQFKFLIEQGGLNTALYNEKAKGSKVRKPMHERQAQKIYYGVAHTYCLTNNLDISPETNSGRGPIDFKLSEGKSSKILVELKLISNPKLDTGLSIQLKEYKKSEKPYATQFVVIDIDSHLNYRAKLNEEIGNMTRRKEAMPEIVYVDGRIKLSASKTTK